MKIHSFLVIKSLISTLDTNVRKYGYQKGILKSFHHYKTPIITKSLTKQTIHVLKNKAVVIVANHPHELDPSALVASLPSRQDSYLIINSRFMGVCKSIDKYLIPVYVRHHNYHLNESTLIGKLIDIFYPTPTYSHELEHRKNIKSISLARQKLKQGA